MKNDFNFCIPYTFQIIELDYMGKVSQAAVLNIFQEARIEYLATLGNYTELNIGEGCGLIQN